MEPTLIDLIGTAETWQVFVDNTAMRQEDPVWNRFFKLKFTNELTWRSFLAENRTTTAATVIDPNSPTPSRVRKPIGQISGSIPAIGEKYVMDPNDLRTYLQLVRNPSPNVDQMQMLVQLLYDDTSAAIMAPHKRLDMIVLEAMSTGKIKWDSTSNPGGTQFEFELGIETKGVTSDWTDGGTDHDPLKDIKRVIDYGKSKGVKYNYIKMTQKTFDDMIASEKFQKVAPIIRTALGGNTVEFASQIITLDMVNGYFKTINYPPIELIDVQINVQTRAGDISMIEPFADNRVTFMNSENLGHLFHTWDTEEVKPQSNKTYAKAKNVLVSKYSKDGEEITEGKLLAFPAFSNMEMMAILKTDTIES
jgi:hypothetical protein